MIASEVEKLVQAAVAQVAPGESLDLALGPPKNPEFGDFTTPVALVLQKRLKDKGQKASPVELGKKLADLLRPDPLFAKVEIAGPGHLNLTLSDGFWVRQLAGILAERERFGRSGVGAGTKVLVEYVSANPTGPLHVGHARNAAVADTTANLLAAAGFEVHREFYVNDLGAQMNNLGRSVWYRYAEAAGKGAFPASAEGDARFEGLYHGEYVKEVAAAFRKHAGDRWLEGAAVKDGVLEPPPGAIEAARDFAYPIILEEQKKTLAAYGVVFDRFFSERSLHDGKLVDKAVEDLRSRGELYEADGALWFASKKHGDDKDRVLRKSDGSWTYFAPDIAYHRDKLQRGFQMLINAWGADHHGYIPRMRAALEALGFDPKRFHVILIQMVRLMRGGAEVKMSKRSGEFVTLQEVIDEVGPDAARYLMLVRASESSYDFDLDLAKQQTNDNPVFYVQYGHARVCSVFRKAREEAPGVEPASTAEALAKLTAPMERELVKRLARFPEEVARAAGNREPHRIPGYLQELVRAFHAYYSKKDTDGRPEHKIVSGDEALTAARLALCDAIRTVLGNGLKLCGVSAPEHMAPVGAARQDGEEGD